MGENIGREFESIEGTINENSTSLMNTTLPTLIMNPTLAFGQEDAITPEVMNNTMWMGNDTGMMGMKEEDEMMLKLNVL